MRILVFILLTLLTCLQAAAPINETTLTPDEIFVFARKAAVNPIKTRLPQIDILKEIYYAYKDDDKLKHGEKHVVIQGDHFAQAYKRAEPLFKEKDNEESDGLLKSQIAPPEILYSNFRTITLHYKNGEARISIALREAYEQEIPYTFGAKIKLARNIEAALRSDEKGEITEVVFDDDNYVFFVAPGIAFFVPDVYTRIARIARKGSEVFGYVIGRPKSAPNRFMAIKYNLTTCAKSSIKTKEIAPDEFSKKLFSLN